MLVSLRTWRERARVSEHLAAQLRKPRIGVGGAFVHRLAMSKRHLQTGSGNLCVSTLNGLFWSVRAITLADHGLLYACDTAGGNDPAQRKTGE
jgi:hypothetical protein